MKPKIYSVEITTHCHATENCDKVLQAVKNLLPENFRNKEPLITEYRGHYGNIIKIIRYILENDEATTFLKYLGGKLSTTDKSILSVSFDLRYDRRSNKFYIRIDKQASYNDRVVVTEGDDIIKIIISFKGSRKKELVRKLLEEYGLVK